MADSGEGKTPVDKYFSESIHRVQDEEAIKYQLTKPEAQLLESTWNITRKAIESAIQENRKRAILTDDIAQIELLDVEFDQYKLHLKNPYSVPLFSNIRSSQ